MYSVVYEKDGAAVAHCVVPALTAVEAHERAETFFKEYPEHDQRGEGFTVRVEQFDLDALVDQAAKEGYSEPTYRTHEAGPVEVSGEEVMTVGGVVVRMPKRKAPAQKA